MTLRKMALGIVGGFLVISFVFLGGWPFLSTEDTPELTREQPVEDQNASGGDRPAASPQEVTTTTTSDDLVERPATEAVPAGVRSDREGLAAAKKKNMVAYRAALSRSVLDFELPRSYRMQRLAELRKVNQATVFRPGRYVGAVDVTIKPGDSLTRIARRVKQEHGNNVTAAFLMKMNRLPNSRIRAGNLLSVATESLSVVISKADYRLYVLLGEEIALDYPVGTGRDDSTPEGVFTVVGKTKNPTWTREDGKVIPFGDPEHTIGTRWLGFADERGKTPYGIHGTVEDDSIGRSESEGCIRMLKDNVEEIFRLIPEGCRVTIRA